MIVRKWDIQWGESWWLSLGFHFDHKDPSLTLHLPGAVVCFGRCKQPGYQHSLYRTLKNNEPSYDFPKLWGLRSFCRYVFGGRCGNECAMTEPYGWVPEGSCPIHDPETRWHWLLCGIARAIRPLSDGDEL